MDYGVRLFRHVVAQVFGNLVPALKLSILPLVIMGAILAWAYTALAQSDMVLTQSMQYENVPPGPVLAVIASALFMFSWVAVGWHRYVLLEEHGTGFSPKWRVDRVLAYLWRLFIIVLLLILASIPVAFLAWFLFAFTGLIGPMLIGFGANFLFTWMFTRMGLILPASAVDKPLTIGQAWAATRDVSGEILVPIIGFAVVFYLLQQVLQLLSAPLGGVIVPVFLGVLWVQMLVNLSLLTTLYGNLVEGRALN